jgi:hypothetical protein
MRQVEGADVNDQGPDGRTIEAPRKAGPAESAASSSKTGRPLRIKRGTTRLEAEWPGTVQVGALPGIVGQPDRAFPSSTSNVLKILRSQGISADRLAPAPEIKLMAAEVWLPFLLVASQVMANVGATLISHAIVLLITPETDVERRSLVHAKFGRVRANGVEYDWIELEGPAAEVADAAHAFFQE